MFSHSLLLSLRSFTRNPELLKVMEYAVLPAGKLFRPRLVEALTLDLIGEMNQDQIHLALAIEFHHAYTLVHDDLPSMDNDLMRRGKASTHAAFGEWKAVLAGDALLVASFEELGKIKSSTFRELHRIFTWATGAKGLIEGQFEDLGSQGRLQLPQIIRIHELKTARLIQVATLGAYILSGQEQKKKEFLRLGREIGVSFQLLDDLDELTAKDVSEHERDINPFLLDFEAAFTELRQTHLRLLNLLEKHQLHKVREMLLDYFKNNQKNLIDQQSTLAKNLGFQNLGPFKEWVTSFV